MTYDPNVPLVTKSPKDSAIDVQTNYSQIFNIFSSTIGMSIYNHIPFNNQFQGLHASVLFQKQTSDPGVDQDLTVLYAKDATSNVSTEPQLFLQIPKFLPTDSDTTNAPNTPMQLTYNTVNTAGPIYQSFMAGGNLVYFGTVTTNNNQENIILSPIPALVLCAIAVPNTVESSGNQKPIKISTRINGNTSVSVFTSFTGSRIFNFVIIARA